MNEEAAGTPDFPPSDRPWLGLKSYDGRSGHQFVGRDEEIDTLTALVRTETLVVLYGASGTGKTSLLRAGLFKRLAAEGFLPCRVLLDHSGNEPQVEAIHAALAQAAAASGAELPARQPGDTLWQRFNRVGSEIWSRANEPLTPVLVFDQFEEIFTLGRGSAQARQRVDACIEELSALVEARSPAHLAADPEALRHYHFKQTPVHVVLSLREDFLPDLEHLRARFRGLQQNRMRLLPMNATQARAVIGLGAHLLADGATEAVLDFVSQVESSSESALEALVEQPETIPGANGEAVRAAWRGDETRSRFSPALLSFFLDELSLKLSERRLAAASSQSLLCHAARIESFGKLPEQAPDLRRIEEIASRMLHDGPATAPAAAPSTTLDVAAIEIRITPKMVRDEGARIFDGFYQRCLQGLPDAVGRFIEQELITRNGLYRESVSRDDWIGKLEEQGATEPLKVLAKLEEHRLLNEENRGRPRVELLHDVLVAPVRRAREKRAGADAEERQRQLTAAYRRRLALASFLAVAMTGLTAFSVWKWNEAEEMAAMILRRDSDDRVRQLRHETAFLLWNCATLENDWRTRQKLALAETMTSVDYRLLTALIEKLSKDGVLDRMRYRSGNLGQSLRGPLGGGGGGGSVPTRSATQDGITRSMQRAVDASVGADRDQTMYPDTFDVVSRQPHLTVLNEAQLKALLARLQTIHSRVSEGAERPAP